MCLGELVSEYKILLEFSRPEYVKEISVSREQEQGPLKVWLQVAKQNAEERMVLSGFDELGQAISSLLEAERAVISSEVKSEKEFGTIRIECWLDERHIEYTCDKAE